MEEESVYLYDDAIQANTAQSDGLFTEIGVHAKKILAYW